MTPDHPADDRQARAMSATERSLGRLGNLSADQDRRPRRRRRRAAGRAGARGRRDAHAWRPAIRRSSPSSTTASRRDATTDLFGGPARAAGRRGGRPRSVRARRAASLRRGRAIPISARTAATGRDNALRFAALARVGADIAHRRASTALRPTSCTPTTGRPRWRRPICITTAAGGPATVITIHNLAFQGHFPRPCSATLGLPRSALSIDGVEYFGGVGFLKAGLQFADRITTVSPTYAREIMTPEFGMALDGLLRARADVVAGIVNGIDDDGVEPGDRSDAAAELQRRCASTCAPRNKTALQQRMGLDAEPRRAAVRRRHPPHPARRASTCCSQALPALVGQRRTARAARLGREGARGGVSPTPRAPSAGSVACVFGYDEALAHLMQAGVGFHRRALALRALRADPALRAALWRDADRRARRRPRRHGHRRQRGGAGGRRRDRRPILAARRPMRWRTRSSARWRCSATPRRCGACGSTACAPTSPGAARPSATPRSTASLVRIRARERWRSADAESRSASRRRRRALEVAVCSAQCRGRFISAFRRRASARSLRVALTPRRRRRLPRRRRGLRRGRALRLSRRGTVRPGARPSLRPLQAARRPLCLRVRPAVPAASLDVRLRRRQRPASRPKRSPARRRPASPGASASPWSAHDPLRTQSARLHPARPEHIPETLRGTFAGLAHPASIAHLAGLGVTSVEIMPADAFVDERHLPPLGLSNAWGYNPVVFGAPDPRLAPGGWAEVRAATDALHAAGIEVDPRRRPQPQRRERRIRADPVVPRPRQRHLLPPRPPPIPRATSTTPAAAIASRSIARRWSAWRSTRCGAG